MATIRRTPDLDRNPAIRIVLLPRDTNREGTIFGGVILSHIDLAGAVQAGMITDQRYLTKALKEVVFKQPVRVGEVVSFYTTVERIGNTSITIHVDVEVMRGQTEIHVTEADVTFVCIDDNGRPTPLVPRSRSGK